MHSKKIEIGKNVSGVVIFTLIAKLMGFFREIVLSYYFGATGVSDAFLISQTIPGTIFQFVGTGLMTCFIPVYFKVLKGKGDTEKYTNKILTVVFVFSTVVISLIWLFTSIVVRMFASGFQGETLYYAIWFTRIGVLSLYFSSMIYVYNSYLQANSIFTATAFAAIPNSICIMVAIVCGAKYNIWLLSILSTAAVGVQLCFLLPALKRTKYHFGMNFHLKDAYVRQFFTLMIPVIVGVSVNEVNTLVDRTVASQVAEGGISALTYANSLIQFVQGGIVQPIATVFYPKITAEVSTNKISEAKKTLSKAIELVLGILIPITVGLMLFCYPITKVLFGRGAFDDIAAKLTSVAVLFYSIGICFVAIREFLSRYFYANSNTRTPMINSTIGVVINIFLNILLYRYIGIAGLAIATSIAAIVTSMLLLRDTKIKIKEGYVRLNVKEIVKIMVSTVIMGGVSYGSYVLFPIKGIIGLSFAVVIAIITYWIVGRIIKLEIISFLEETMKKFLIKKK